MSGIFSITGNSASTGFYDYSINQSLRFEDGDSAYLNKTYGSSAGGNTSTWTFSVWLKIGNPSAQKVIWAGSAAGGGYTTNLFYIQLRGDTQSNRLDITWRQNSSTTRGMSTNREFRDPSAWMHIVLACDTTQATASNRLRLYINGSEETSFSSDDRSTISQSSALPINANSYDHAIGRSSYSASAYFDGYMAEINFVDGSQLAPTSFGKTKAGIWIPKNYTGSHGTTGFYLPFDDGSALGDDESANTNDWTPSGLASTDVVLDSPTNNFATMNVNDGNGPTISEGNLKVFGDTSFSVFEGFKGTFPMSSGKWYWEVYIDVGGFTQTGITPTTNTAVISTTNLSYHTDAMTYESNGNKAIGTGGTGTAPSSRTTTSYGASYTDGDIIGVALDLDSSTTTLTFYKNNSTQGTAFSSLASDEYVPVHTGIQNNFGIFNFGQDSSFAGNKTSGSAGASDANGNGDFYYTPPSGHLACCSASLPDPAIDPAQDEEPADYFNTVLYAGNGSTGHAITGVGFQPDWVWIKGQNYNGASHALTDSVRGATKRLISDTTASEATNAQYLQSFDSDGFTVGNHAAHNSGSHNFVSWNWLAGGSAVSNGQGSITSSVSANTESGFSIVSYTGNATAGATVGHGLSKTPEMYIVKSRSLGTSWVTYHKDAATSPEDGYLVLNGTDAFFDTVVWNDTAPTSSVFSLGGTGYSSNNSGATYIAYCFHSVDGFSKVGKYTSTNNSSFGPYIHLGFRPAWVMVKNVTTGGSNYDWTIYDNKRSPINPISGQLEANTNADEESTRGVPIDFLSNGFKPRNSFSEVNGGSSNTYIYLAFAEQPAKYSNAR